MTSLLDDAFARHVWATERLIDTCATLPREQLVTATPGTYGPIMATLALAPTGSFRVTTTPLLTARDMDGGATRMPSYRAPGI